MTPVEDQDFKRESARGSIYTGGKENIE